MRWLLLSMLAAFTACAPEVPGLPPGHGWSCSPYHYCVRPDALACTPDSCHPQSIAWCFGVADNPVGIDCSDTISTCEVDRANWLSTTMHGGHDGAVSECVAEE